MASSNVIFKPSDVMELQETHKKLAMAAKQKVLQDWGVDALLESVMNPFAERRSGVSEPHAGIKADFKEGKLREILNFGHTLGHALEKSSHYSLRHGEAISIGLHFAALLSQSELGFSEREATQLRALLEKFDLPTTVRAKEYEFANLLALMVGDKKSRDGRIRFVGLRTPGEPDWIEAATPEILLSTYEKIAL